MAVYDVENLTIAQIEGTANVRATWDAIDLGGVPVMYYVWARGQYAGETTATEWTVAGAAGEVVSIRVLGSDDLDFDPVEYSDNLPRQRPHLEWTRPLNNSDEPDQDIAFFDVFVSQVWSRELEPDGIDDLNVAWRRFVRIVDTAPSVWSWTVALPPLSDDESYRVRLQAQDGGGNVGVLADDTMNVFGYADQVRIVNMAYDQPSKVATFAVAFD